MVDKKEQKNIEKLKENILHGNILFNLAVHLTENRIATDIMLYTHWHEELEILYILDGSMLLQIDIQAFRVSKGDVIVIPPNLLHGATRYNNSHCSFYAIVFHPSFILSALNDIIQQSYLDPFFIKSDKRFYHINEESKDQCKILHNVISIIEAYKSKGFGFELLIKAYVLQILYHLIDINSEKNNELSKDDLLSTLRIKKILTFLEDNYQKSFSLSDWASNIDLSKEQFCRIFKKHFSKTPIEYLMHYRISKAADLLIHSHMPIIDIAFETGFESANYFTIVFKNKTQMTPRQFRKSNGYV
jgi:AraC-like DNA-binding protein/mannose-6-phosphate isomerase-like protein (cupin superfamily)